MNATNCNKNNMKKNVDNDMYGNEITDKEKQTRLLSILRQTTVKDTAYDAKKYPSGYHTWKLPSATNSGLTLFKGQRNCLSRLNALVKVGKYVLKDKVVLDIGCNQGNCLVEIADQIKYGVGIDNNYELINCANRLSSHFQKHNVSFYTYDVQVESKSLNRILTFLPYTKPHIIFLLAVCQWIKNWEELITWCYENSQHMLFEDNGNKQQQLQHQQLLDQLYGPENIIDLRHRENGRILLLCCKIK
jgi:hypothetical protein